MVRYMKMKPLLSIGGLEFVVLALQVVVVVED